MAKLEDKQQPNDADITKNLDQTKDQILEEKRQEAFQVFASNVISEYKKKNLVRVNSKSQQTPNTGE